MYQKGRAWIEVDLDKLVTNVKELTKLLPDTCRLMPAVKANAYGHGAAQIAKTLNGLGIDSFCVASALEGVQLRKAGVQGQILVLGYTHPGQMELLHQFCLTQSVVDSEYAKILGSLPYTVLVHVGVDTGMNRLGECWRNTDIIAGIWNYKNLQVTGLFSHCCVSDSQRHTEREITLSQEQRFWKVVEELHSRGINGFTCHLHSSYGILNYSQTGFDYARAGISIYGILSSRQDETLSCPSLRPVLSVKSRIETVKMLCSGESAGYGMAFTASGDTTIAVVSIGYADGIPRNLSEGKGYVLVHGRRAPIAGRICMDQLSIDITGIEGVKPGDEVILIGSSGGQSITAMDVAAWSDTISNEILSRLGTRLERIYYPPIEY